MTPQRQTAEGNRTMAVLQSVQSKTETELLQARIAELEAKLAASKRVNKLTFRVSEKGAMSVYGMGKWPVTLYAAQWTRLLDAADDIRAFLKANADELTTKE